MSVCPCVYGEKGVGGEEDERWGSKESDKQVKLLKRTQKQL